MISITESRSNHSGRVRHCDLREKERQVHHTSKINSGLLTPYLGKGYGNVTPLITPTLRGESRTS